MSGSPLKSAHLSAPTCKYQEKDVKATLSSADSKSSTSSSHRTVQRSSSSHSSPLLSENPASATYRAMEKSVKNMQANWPELLNSSVRIENGCNTMFEHQSQFRAISNNSWIRLFLP
jgi:hypothetical protein